MSNQIYVMLLSNSRSLNESLNDLLPV
ncbi:protein of unknown function [Rhodovastum atsumiense]|nr:protein of unknown function [Rhodovastum atsumiense]